MTPEREHVWIGYCDLCNGQHCVTIKAADAKVERRLHTDPVCVAALRERDAALAYELEAEAVDIKSRHACPLLAIGVAQACGPCSEAAALYRKASSIRRALLEEAGK